ncbi:LacI family DNA-binding transcriptional regulator [Halobacillus hunanensis]|uniref:LacI family DNA-binding transcriptional regulator n=1 Tax=Halobacillus hunanensis TaxID=578214 RepID=UPI0009A7699A|nr:LacI family DNA-binding transcriptional regulator [Halobacillus hunanensis]
MTTIKDIAKTVGVSITTVSRALNGYSDVNEKTRNKIKQVAKDLHYSPNAVARSLVMNQTKTIGLLVSGLTRSGAKDNIVFDVLTGVNDYCGENDYDIVLFNTTTSKQKEKTYAQLCRERRVDGVIVQGIKKNDPYLIEIIENQIPCVLVDIPIEEDAVGYVTTDNINGILKAVDYLVSLGHQNIAMVNGHDQAFVSQERLKGYHAGLKKHQIPMREDWVVNGEFEEEAAEKVTQQLLTEDPSITALVCASDLMAFGAIHAAKKLGYEIPKDISVVGFDNIVLSSYVTPTLTTISQDTHKIGVEAAKLLIELLEKKDNRRSTLLPNELIVRETTAANRH